MIGFVLAGYIIGSADVAHLSVLIHKAVCAFKSTQMQRGKLSDKEAETMKVLLEEV